MAKEPLFLPKDGQRKWQCFVCGKQHDNYEEYKAHIVGEHDPGREYISCEACEAPVRDLAVHYKLKHPNRLLPKNCQTRVSIWKDFTSNRRKKPKFKTGEFVSEKMNGAALHYRSGLECEIYQLLEKDDDVIAYFPEPFKIPYCYEGKWYDYIPDLRLNFVDGSTEIWEIKPSNQTGPRNKKNQSKWAAMQEHCQKMGWKFNVITEVGKDKLRMRVNEMRLIKNLEQAEKAVQTPPQNPPTDP